MRKEVNIGIQEVFDLCSELIFQYEPTEGYNHVPEGAEQTDIAEYIDTQFFEIRLAVMQIFRNKKDIAKRFLRIVDEFEIFVHSCEIPGVVDRWKQINPDIQYFDTAFELMDGSPEAYENISMGQTGLKLRCYPTERISRERKQFFQRARLFQEHLGLEYSETRAFEFELWNTLKKVLQNDFREYR